MGNASKIALAGTPPEEGPSHSAVAYWRHGSFGSYRGFARQEACYGAIRWNCNGKECELNNRTALAKNVRRIGHLDLAGAGQITVQGRYAYVMLGICPTTLISAPLSWISLTLPISAA